jgi:hypothetical protein
LFFGRAPRPGARASPGEDFAFMLSNSMQCAGFFLMVSAALAMGCSSDSTPRVDAAAYAQDVKQDIHDLITAVQGKPKLAREQGAVLLEKLQEYQKQPIGEYGPIYAQMLEKVRELAQRVRGSAEVDRILADLRKLANQLPGTVKSPPPD